MKKNNKRLSNGTYSILLTVLIAVALIIINLIIGKIPSQNTQIDFSTAKLYTLTDTTIEFLNTLEEEVKIYYICEGGEEDDTTQKLLERYQDASSKLQIEQIDPVLYPGFTSQYEETALDNNSVIVVYDEKHKTIPAEEFYITEYSTQRNGYVQGAFDGEGQITSAIDYVTSNDLPIIYVIAGNGENALSDTYRNAILKTNVELRELNLLTATEIPEDATALLMMTPSNDYTQKEVEVVIQYLEKGGKAILFSDYNPDPPVNYLSILSNYGMETKPGIILEGDSNHYISYQYCVIPDVQYSEITASVYGKKYILMPMSQGIKVQESHRDSISYQPLLITSMGSYSKTDVQNMKTSEKEEGDLNGPFPIGMLIQEDLNQDHTYDTELVYFSSGYLMDEDYNMAVSEGNSELVSSAISYISKGADHSKIMIAPKTLQVPYLTMTSFNANLFSVIVVFVLPLLFLIVGFVIWIKRRKN